MPWIVQMLWVVLMFIGVAFALWISFWVLLALFMLGVVMVAWSHLRDFLLAKGILNPTPGVPPTEESVNVTLIEGDFTRVDEEKHVE